MATLESLRRKVEATEDLQSVVRTMKALAAVNIRQYEQAVTALAAYRRTVELALRVVLRHARGRRHTQARGAQTAALLVVGSDQGMCGQFNEEIADHAQRVLSRADAGPQHWLILAVGEKASVALEAREQPVALRRHLPGSANMITATVRGVLAVVEQWQRQHGSLQQVVLTYNRYDQHGFMPHDQVLLPIDQPWLDRLREQPWPTRSVPMFYADPARLLSQLVRQYLFIQLYGALAESMAAENATRLRAMQSAEKNVDERLDELNTRYNRQRQNSITAELLDVISGSEAVAS